MVFLPILTGPATGALVTEEYGRLATTASAGATVNFTLPTAEVDNG